MRRRHKVGSPLLIGAAVVILLCILSAVYSGISGNSSPITRAAGAVVRPFQRFGTGVGHFFSKGLDYFTEFDALKAENEQLKQQISANAQLVRDAQIALEENNQLRSQLGQPENTRTTTTVSAEVIARSPGDWADTLTLDKGSSSGVNKDDLVTTVDGMLGFVSEVTDNTCEVTSITDPKMQCGALVTRTRETAIAEGDYNLMTRGALRLSYLREDSKVVVGDTVETSGRGGVFPKGILIGTVESVQPEESGLSYYAVIKPFVSVDSVSSVSIITEYTDTAEAMQREQISIPKLIAYVLFSVIIFALQTGTFGGMRIFGSAVDLLPALVTAAALLGGPAEAAATGVTVGICYDLSFTGVDGLYPLFFLLFGYAAGKLCQRLLTRNYISMLILTAFECVLLGLLRYLFSLMHAGASFLIVLRQLAVGTVLTCLFCFIVYLPLRRLSGKSRKRSR